MRQSQLFTKTMKQDPQGDSAINAILLQRAGFVDKVMSGVYTFLPLGNRVLSKIEQIIREEMNRASGQEILMPVMHPRKNWEQTGRWKSMDVLFRFTSYYSKTDLVLGPTHEEIVAPLLKKYIYSYKDLPQYVYQIQTKFRDEIRAKSGLLRGREFRMKDLYSFHTSQEDLDRYYEVMVQAYKNVFERVGLGKITVLTFASGGTFSKYSHEFQTLLDQGEDLIYLCEKCMVGVNREIIHEQNSCPNCGDKNLKESKASEVGNIFKLGTKYSLPFELKYKDEKGIEKDVFMGCYGIGPSRTMGVLVEAFHDDKGIIWPESVSPFKFHLLCLDKEVIKQAENLYKQLLKRGAEVLFDDRVDISAGEKLVDSDLIGITNRIVVSKKTIDKKMIEIKKRSAKRAELIKEKELFSKI
ncbi:MAG: aminoacyl--tRNA ligase-related protein [Patescibacteria group bacterium]